jgi:predicted amidohydrolase YtcJ
MKTESTTIYHGGNIVTVNDAQPRAEALAVKGGKIMAVGSLDDVRKEAGSTAQMIDLNGHTLLPGFIDAHSHLSITAEKLDYANLSRHPIGPVRNIADLKKELNRYKESRDLKPGDWIVGMGYDPSHMEEGRHPTRDDLDEISTDHPVLAIHFSGGHMVAVNSKLLEIYGYTSETPDPPGGHIQRYAGTNEPNGVLEELACMGIRNMIPPRAFNEHLDIIEKAVELYRSKGYTTVQEGAIFTRESYDVLKSAAEQGRLKIDVVGYPLYPAVPELMKHYDPAQTYGNNFRIGGAKLLLDGGLPGYTAYLREPYHKKLPGMAQDYRAYPFYEDQGLIDGWVAEFFENDWPHLIHALGDAAIDQFLEAVEKAEKNYPGKDRRPVLIHAIVMPEDQLDRARDLGVVVSFFSAHNHIFSDFHVSDTIGPDRGARINPAASALKRSMKFTIHHDSPVTPVDQLFLIWAAVNRVGESGEVHGPDQCISPLEALKASTIYAAYQYFEEHTKGSLEPGKIADMVILSDNPLTVDPMAIREIEILETIKEGVTVYRR